MRCGSPAKVGKSHAPDYGKTLLDAMAAVRKYRETVGAVPLSENKQLLKRKVRCSYALSEKIKRRSPDDKRFDTKVIVLSAAFVGVYPAAAARDVGETGKRYLRRADQTVYKEEGSLPLFQIAFSQLDGTAKMGVARAYLYRWTNTLSGRRRQ